jgi:signal transduction histidine kinase
MRVVRSHLLLMIAAGFAVGILLAGSFVGNNAYILMIGSAVLAVVASLALLLVATARLREIVNRESTHAARSSTAQGREQEFNGVRPDLGIARISAGKPEWETGYSFGSGVAEALQRLVDQALVVFGARRVEIELVDLSSGIASGEPERVAEAENRGIAASSGESFACYAQPLLFSGSSLGTVRIWVPKVDESAEGDGPSRTKVITALGFFAREIIMVVMSAWYATHRLQREREVHVAAGNSLLDHFGEAVSEPIGTVLTGAELLLAGDFGELDLVQRRGIELLRRDARKLRGLTEDITLYKRVSAGAEHSRPVSFDAWECTNAVLKTFRALFEQKAHTVVFAPRAEQPFYAHCDSAHFARILSALIRNAIAYTPPGGCITVALSHAADGQLTVDVHDTGVGISHHDMAHLMEPFRRGTHPYARMQSGIGLGLSLAQGLVRLQGGELSLSSTIGEGTHVLFSVPAGSQPLLPLTVEGGDREVAAHGERILFVQPEESDSVLVVQYLERRGYRVVVALSEKEARRELKRHQIALVLLTDLFEPEPSSRLAEFVREEQRGRHIPVVLLTRRAFLIEGDWYLREDIDNCFLRPVDIEVFGAACSALTGGEVAAHVAEALAES